MTALVSDPSFVTRNQATPAMPQPTAAPRRHLLTVALEDYFQVGAFNQLIQRGQWYRFETRLEKNTARALELLGRYGIKATFFVLGWIADRFPELVRKVAEAGHEVASRGYYHRPIGQMSPAEFREDLARTREALEKAAGRRVLGYRVADDWFGPADLWALDVLAEEGYAYDSSLAPRLREFAHEPWRRFTHQHTAGDRKLWEFPISSIRLLRWVVPIGGGNYFRQFPHWLVRRAVRRWDREYQIPFVMYFHVWELDPEQPKISSAGLLARIRHYRNLGKMQPMLEYYFQCYTFTSAASYLKLSTELPSVAAGLQPADSAIEARSASEGIPSLALRASMGHRQVSGENLPPREEKPRTPVTLVVPCYNEELILPYLANTLKSVIGRLEQDYELSFVFVNDGSKDGTGAALHKIFGDWPRTTIHHHEINRGVAAAILTGIRQATTELVCSIDCDCTYDPHELANMIPLLTEGTDVVTASPYHPQGAVRNVPGWRLLLSRGSSFLYRRVLRQKLYTYTSCFRLYRRSAVKDLAIRETGFLGVAEILGKLDLKGSRIVEYPAVLEVRMLGRSKMKTIRTILGHLKLMTRLLWLRLRGGAAPLPPVPAPVPEPHPPQESLA